MRALSPSATSSARRRIGSTGLLQSCPPSTRSTKRSGSTHERCRGGMLISIGDRHFVLAGILSVAVRNPDAFQRIAIEMRRYSVKIDPWFML